MTLCQRLPLHKGGLDLVPLEWVFATNAWLTGQQKTHLCVACSIRAMPETEIPPAMRVDYYFLLSLSKKPFGTLCLVFA